MQNHEKVMSIRESQRLVELEKTIARGKKTFVEVGLALAEIRDLRLYKQEYSSFQEYCQKKWGWNRTYAHYMIEGAEVVKALPEKVFTIVNTEAAARELGKAPVEQRPARTPRLGADSNYQSQPKSTSPPLPTAAPLVQTSHLPTTLGCG